MTAESANSFLKTLEEPKPDTVFILLSFSDSGILRTIISRCQKVLFEEGGTLADAKGRDVLLEAEAIGQEIASARKNGLSALLKVSSRLAVRDGGVEDLLAAFSEALWKARKNNFPVKAVRVILDALSAIKKRANVRLALDVMCLKLWEI
jgi:DNA polymerase III delta prime subunit